MKTTQNGDDCSSLRGVQPLGFFQVELGHTLSCLHGYLAQIVSFPTTHCHGQKDLYNARYQQKNIGSVWGLVIIVDVSVVLLLSLLPSLTGALKKILTT